VKAKHFEALAQALHRQQPAPHWDANERVQWALDVEAVADVCGQFNERFDRQRFVEACSGRSVEVTR
jgi:hypothetical protein